MCQRSKNFSIFFDFDENIVLIPQSLEALFTKYALMNISYSLRSNYQNQFLELKKTNEDFCLNLKYWLISFLFLQLPEVSQKNVRLCVELPSCKPKFFGTPCQSVKLVKLVSVHIKYRKKMILEFDH